MKKTTQLCSILFVMLFTTLQVFSNTTSNNETTSNRAVSTAMIVTYYVDINNTNAIQDGQSWETAFPTINEALQEVTDGDEILIAAGVYNEGEITIDTSNMDNITLKGGYPTGGGTQDVANNITVLSGDDNNRVLSISNTTITATINGITIQDGNVIGNGAGIANLGGGISNVGDLTIINCLIHQNYAQDFGGGIYNEGTMNISNSRISENEAPGGGGIENDLGTANLTITSCYVNDNIGGGIANYFANSLKLINSSVYNNTVLGGIYNGSATMDVINSIISNNVSIGNAGAGVFNDLEAVTNINNSIIWGNTVTGANPAGSPEYDDTIDSSIVLTFVNSLVKGENVTGTDNIDATIAGFDPLFTDATNNDFTLKAGSPLIDAGLNSSNFESLDILGNTRVFNTTIDIGPFEFNNNIIWTGVTDNDWDTATNWNIGTTPTTISDVIIPNDVTNYPTAATAVTVNTITINSGASFIANGNVTGTVTYRRNLSDTDWYLISSPVEGETIDNLIANHTFATGTGANIGFAPYSNSDATPWNYTTNTGSIESGRGYSVKFDAPDDISFTGTMNTNSFTPYPLTNGTRTDYNLIGNPYTSYMNLNRFLDDEGNQEALQDLTIWIWNGTEYVTENLANNSFSNSLKIAPAQGFFVKAIPDILNVTNNNNNGIAFLEDFQSHESTDTFSKEEVNPNFELFIANNKAKKSTKVFYIADKTTGLDNGYDSEMFADTTYDLAVFTALVTDNQGGKLAIQTLPDTSQTIPVGVIATAGENITFSVESVNLPEDVTIYLENKLTDELVNLSEENYTTTLTTKSEGTGQFYIHTSAAKTLNIADNQTLNTVSVYTSATKQITITGLDSDATVKVYSLLGKEVFATSITEKAVLNLPNISTGVYLVKVQSDLGSVSKKIIIE